MGQYYKTIILSDSVPEEGKQEIIRLALSGHAYRNGLKLTEHSWIGNAFVEVIEWLISPVGMFHKSRIVWAGDYADSEPIVRQNLYHITNKYEEQSTYPHMMPPKEFKAETYRYIINHTKREYVDKERAKADTKANTNNEYREDIEYVVHPLPLLVAEGNGCGGGDYRGDNEELCGSWTRDIISVETSVPDGFTERVCGFRE